MPPIDDDVANFMSPERAELYASFESMRDTPSEPLRPLVPKNGVRTGARISC
jgi:hypothetical protein